MTDIKTRVNCLILLALLLSVFTQVGQTQETDSFSLRGVVKNVDGNNVGSGYKVNTVNQRVMSGWLTDPAAETRVDGTFTTSFIDIFGSNRTKAGDQIAITVTEIATGKVKVKKTYIVTVADVGAREANVSVILSGITTTFDPSAVLADGQATSVIKISVQDEGEAVTNDTLTITQSKVKLGK